MLAPSPNGVQWTGGRFSENSSSGVGDGLDALDGARQKTTRKRTAELARGSGNSSRHKRERASVDHDVALLNYDRYGVGCNAVDEQQYLNFALAGEAPRQRADIDLIQPKKLVTGSEAENRR